MNIVVADDGAPGHRKTVQFAAHHCVGGAATVVGHVSWQEDEAYRIGEVLIDLIHDLRQVEVILLAGLSHMKIAKVNPANYTGSVERVWLERHVSMRECSC